MNQKRELELARIERTKQEKQQMLRRYDVNAQVDHNYIPQSLNPNAMKELEI